MKFMKFTITQGNPHFNEKSRRAKLMTKDGSVMAQMSADDAALAHSNDKITCYACRTSWTPACFGCYRLNDLPLFVFFRHRALDQFVAVPFEPPQTGRGAKFTQTMAAPPSRQMVRQSVRSSVSTPWISRIPARRDSRRHSEFE